MVTTILLFGLVGSKLIGERTRDALGKLGSQWHPPDFETIPRHTTLNYSGWAKPNTRVQVREELLRTTQLGWIAPAMPFRPYRRRCRNSTSASARVETCFQLGYEGFYWAPPIRVSGNLSCPQDCILWPTARHVVWRQTLPPLAEDFGVLHDLINPLPNPAMNLPAAALTTLRFNMDIAGPTRGTIWFKPLMWACSGWYTRMSLAASSSHFVRTQLEVRFPIVIGSVIEGAFAFVRAT